MFDCASTGNDTNNAFDAFDFEAHQPTTKIPDRQKLAAISPIYVNSEKAIEENYL